jgi:hypothetical protein
MELLWKLIVAQFVNNFAAYYTTQNFINMFTGPYPEPDESSQHPATSVFLRLDI